MNMIQLTAFSMALALLFGVVLPVLEHDGDIRPADDRRADDRPQWVRASRGAPLVRNPYALASCTFNPRLAGQVQRVEELWAETTSTEGLRAELASERKMPWCGYECKSQDIAWKETAGDPDEEGCWVWVEYYRRSLINQRPWPFCTCKYEWSLLERTCEVDSGTLAGGDIRGGVLEVADAFPDTALHDFLWAAGW